MAPVSSLTLALTALLTLVGGSSGAGVWPMDPLPAVVRGFEPPATAWGSGHRGVDLLGRPGQPVRAAEAGQITFAGTLAGRGVVVVDHGMLRTSYEPVAPDVHVGDHVAKGQRIGALQTGASHCFPRACLHWGLLRGDTYLDPLTLVGGGPVRLLPLAGALRAASGPTPNRLFAPAVQGVGAGSGSRTAGLIGRG